MDFTFTHLGTIERLVDEEGFLRAYRMTMETPNGLRSYVVPKSVAQNMCERFQQLTNS